MYSIRTTTAVGAVLLAALTGCGGSSKAAAKIDAAGAVAKLQAAGLPVTGVAVVTAANDPNHLLGRPNGYTSKETFADTRVDTGTVKDDTPGSVDLGGAVEVFTSAKEAKARADYIHTMESAIQFVGTEYDYVSGSVLLRVSQSLTPDQAATYQKALG